MSFREYLIKRATTGNPSREQIRAEAIRLGSESAVRAAHPDWDPVRITWAMLPTCGCGADALYVVSSDRGVAGFCKEPAPATWPAWETLSRGDLCSPGPFLAALDQLGAQNVTLYYVSDALRRAMRPAPNT